jgi:hypothetical protein
MRFECTRWISGNELLNINIWNSQCTQTSIFREQQSKRLSAIWLKRQSLLKLTQKQSTCDSLSSLSSPFRNRSANDWKRCKGPRCGTGLRMISLQAVQKWALLWESRPSTGLKETEETDARGWLAGIEERAKQHYGAIAVLQNKFEQLSTDFRCFVGEVSALPSAPAGMQTLIGEISVEKAQIAEHLWTRWSDLEWCDHITYSVNYRQERSRREVNILKGIQFVSIGIWLMIFENILTSSVSKWNHMSTES